MERKPSLVFGVTTSGKVSVLLLGFDSNCLFAERLISYKYSADRVNLIDNQDLLSESYYSSVFSRYMPFWTILPYQGANMVRKPCAP